MQDSNIVFKITTVGVEEATAKMDSLGATITKLTFNANGTVTASGKLTDTLKNQTDATNKATAATDRASKSQGNYFVHIAKTTVQSALVNKAFLGLVEASGNAVKQVDLFNNFPASMAALGLSAKDASDSLLKLRDYSSQTGVNLTDATQTVARFAEVTKNVKAATAEFVGVNNALIAGGAGAEVQKNAMEQLIQAYSRGKPQLIEWRSLLVAMPAQLSAVAKAMGQPSAQALGEQLTSGKISMQAFLTQLTKMSTGTGEIAKQMRAHMSGIALSTNIMKSALTNGIASIIQAIGRENIVAFFTFLTQAIAALAQWAVIAINDLISLFNIVSKVFGGPQIAHFTGEAQGAADALGDGAGNADDMANGLGDASDNAKKLSKQLASFDKMNVLQDKSKDTSGNNPVGLSPQDASALEGIFGGIENHMAAISGWAKLFAGILAGIVGLKFAKGILDQLNDTVKTFKDATKNAKDFGKAVKDLGGKVGNAFKGTPTSKESEAKGASIGKSLITGLATAIGAAAGSIWRLLFVPLGTAIAAAIAPIIAGLTELVIGLAVILGIPIELVVALIVAAVAIIIGIIFLIWKNWDTIWGWIKDSASASWQFIQKVWDGITNFFVKIWQGIYKAFKTVADGIKNGFKAIVDFIKSHITLFEIIFSPLLIGLALIIVPILLLVKLFQFLWDQITGLFSGAPGFFSNVFQSALDVISVIWGVVVAFFTAIWDGIKLAFSTVAKFFGDIFSTAWDAVTTVWDIVASWFNDHVLQPIFTFFTPVADFFKERFQTAYNNITAVFSVIGDFFKQRWDNIKANFSEVATFFGNIFSTAYDKITGVFGGLWNWFKINVWDKLVSLFTSVGTTVGDAITNAVKGVFNAVLKGIGGIWNTFLVILNKAIDVVKNIPGTGFLKHIDPWTVPQLARGGVIDQPTLAMVGEAGKEAVVPLENNTEWINTLASKINGKQSDGQPIQLVVQIGEDKIVSKVIELINEKTNMTGRNAILV